LVVCPIVRLCCLGGSFILELAAFFQPGDGPGEMRNGDDEEAVAREKSAHAIYEKENS